MMEIGVLKNFDSGTYKAGVQLAGYVILAIPGGNPRDAVVIAVFTS